MFQIQKSLLLQFIRLLVVLAALVSLYIIISYALKFIYPLIIAGILAYSIYPFTNFLEKRARLPKFVAIFAVMLGLFLISIGILFLIITEIYQGSTFLAEQIPKHYRVFVIHLEQFFNTNLLPFYEKVLSIFQSLDSEYQQTISEYIRSFTNFIANSGTEVLQSSLAKIPSLLAILPSSLTKLMFILLATFMITSDLENIKQKTTQILPREADKNIKQLFHHFKLAVTGFFRAQFILISISACIILIGLIILQVEHALTISIIASAVDLIPYIGTGIIFIPWIIYLYAVGDYPLTIGISIIYMIVIISRQLLEPKVLSSKIGIHPLILLIGMFVGIQVWGVAGLFISPLLIVLGNAAHQAGIIQMIWGFIRG